MHNKKIAIVGNGNVGQAFYKGFINHHNGYGSSSVHCITRDYFDGDPRTGSRDILLKEYDIIILAVKPKDAVRTLTLIKDESIGQTPLIVSTVSGLSMDIIVRILRIPYDRIVKMTLNTNIEYGNGVIVYSTTKDETAQEARDLLMPLCKSMILKVPSHILPAVTYVGSENAFFTKYVLLRAQDKPEIPFSRFIDELTMEDEHIQQYMNIVGNVYSKLFNDEPIVDITTWSTLETLKASCNSTEDLIRRIEAVGTEGGSTRMGIDDFNSLEKMKSKFFMETFPKVYRKSITFAKGPEGINAAFDKQYDKFGNLGMKKINSSFAA